MKLLPKDVLKEIDFIVHESFLKGVNRELLQKTYHLKETMNIAFTYSPSHRRNNLIEIERKRYNISVQRTYEHQVSTPQSYVISKGDSTPQRYGALTSTYNNLFRIHFCYDCNGYSIAHDQYCLEGHHSSE